MPTLRNSRTPPKTDWSGRRNLRDYFLDYLKWFRTDWSEVFICDEEGNRIVINSDSWFKKMHEYSEYRERESIDTDWKTRIPV